MTILTRQERERLVIELYNQGKTYRQISKEARISPRDIGIILNKAVEEKNTEGSKEENNNDADKNKEEEQQSLSLSTQAYKLFSEGKAPLEVSITLNLRESEATKFCREYWKLKQLHNLNTVYEELGDEGTGDFLRLYKLAKAKGVGVRQVIHLLKIANNNLPEIEWRYERLKNDVSMLQSQKHTCTRKLYQLNNQTATTSRVLSSLRISCERESKEIESLYNEKTRLEAVVSKYKNNNKEYLNIKEVTEDKVKSVLTNGKMLLKFATLSVIESLRMNSELYNFVIYDNSNNDTISYGPNYLSLMSGGQQQHQEQSFNGRYAALILEEAEKL